MALEIKRDFPSGVEAKKCYAKITGVNYFNSPDHILVEVTFFYNEEARLNKLPWLEVKRYDASEEQVDDSRSQAYIYLKTLDEFKNAKDV